MQKLVTLDVLKGSETGEVGDEDPRPNSAFSPRKRREVAMFIQIINKASSGD